MTNDPFMASVMKLVQERRKKRHLYFRSLLKKTELEFKTPVRRLGKRLPSRGVKSISIGRKMEPQEKARASKRVVSVECRPLTLGR